MTDEKDSSVNEDEVDAGQPAGKAADVPAAKADAKASKKTAKKSNKPSIWKRIGDFFKSYKGELKKITWPTAKQTFKNTGNVLLAMAIVGVIVCLLDLALSQLVSLLLQIGS